MPPALFSRRFLFTWNNYAVHDSTLVDVPSTSEAPARTAGDRLSQRLEALPYHRYHIFQFEEGDAGTPHVQGYIHFTRGVRATQLLRACSGIYLTVPNGSPADNIRYCSKDETRVSGPYSGGCRAEELQGQGSRSDLAAAAGLIAEGGRLRDVVAQQPSTFVRYHKGLIAMRLLLDQAAARDAPQVHLLFGVTGVGKSHVVHAQYTDDPWELHSKPAGKWFDGLDGQSALLFDDFDGEMPLRQLLVVLDRYRAQVETKGGFASLSTVKKIYITSNVHPRDWYSWDRREAQFAALQRRIHFVHCFDEQEVNTDDYPLRFIADSDRFFFARKEERSWTPLPF